MMVHPAVPVAENTVVISEQDCRRLARHAPSAGVTHTPGVNVRGGAVKPANLSSYGSIPTPRHVLVDLNLPIKVFKPEINDRLADAEVKVGLVEVDLNSQQVVFNGIPLTDPEIARLVAACREAEQD